MNDRLFKVGVTVPISAATSPKAHARLKRINAVGAAADAQDSCYVQAAPNESQSSARWRKVYDRAMDRICGSDDGKIPPCPQMLQDAVLTTEAPLHPPGSGLDSVTANIYDPSDVSTEMAAPLFTIEDEY